MLNQIRASIGSLIGGKEIVILLISVICICWMISYMSYFNAFLIIKNFINQYKDNDGNYKIGLLFGSYIIPALLAVVVLLQEPEQISDNVINGITLIITVLTALFFTIVGLVAELKVKIEDTHKSAAEKARLNRLCIFVFQADMFEILACILLLIYSDPICQDSFLINLSLGVMHISL